MSKSRKFNIISVVFLLLDFSHKPKHKTTETMAGGMRSVDLSDPEIQQAWQEVRNDASDSNWSVNNFDVENHFENFLSFSSGFSLRTVTEEKLCWVAKVQVV